MMKQSRDFARVFSENWNRKLKSVRLLGAVVSLCMLVCAVLCMHSAVPMHQALKTAAALVIIALGMYQLVDYYYMPVLLRDGGTLIGAVLNTVIGMLLLFSPVEITVSVFAYMFGFLLMIFGVNKITFANKLHFFGIFDYSKRSYEYTCCCCFSDNPAHIHCDAEYGTCRLLGCGWNHIACGSGYHEKYEDRGCSGMNGDSRI